MFRRLLPGLLVVLLGAALWLGREPLFSPLLTVRNPSGTLLFSTHLPETQEFGIRFVHSVALSPVEEWFANEDGLLALRRTVYQDFGAGLPHEAGKGQRMEFVDGGIVLSGFSMKLPALDVRVGRVAGHELMLPGAHVPAGASSVKGIRLLPLAAWAPPGTALTFRLEDLSLWERVRTLFR